MPALTRITVAIAALGAANLALAAPPAVVKGPGGRAALVLLQALRQQDPPATRRRAWASEGARPRGPPSP